MTAPEVDPRLDQLVDLIVSWAGGNMGRRLEPSPAQDTIDAVITGINSLADELQQVYQHLEARVAERTAELARAQGELERLALTDALTGLANRSLLGDRISQAIRRAERGALPPTVILIDLDEFKFINDTLGHGVGDAVLIEVANRLRTVIRVTDTIGRLGGDEFAIVLPDTAEVEALRIARRALLALQLPVQVDGRELNVTASIGLRFGLRGQTGDSLLRDADIAMYQAKANGKSNVQVFEPSMHHASQQRMEILSELTGAVDRGELTLHYQPIVRLADRAVVGAEALLRWERETNGLTLPGSFISIAEDSGLIAELGRWALETAVRTVRDRLAELPATVPFTLHLNISASELRRPGFAEFVRQTLEYHDVPARRIALEIAESGLLSGDVRELQTLVELRQLGVSVQIDDFGTGDASIASLRVLPVDTIKVDRSVLADIDQPAQRRFVHAVLQLIESVGLEAIVEGIETESQLAGVIALGATRGQGYLFGKPMPESGLQQMLRQQVDPRAS